MDAMRSSSEEEIGLSGMPHLVILGAGASKAACPKGDKYGKPLPLMNDLNNLLGLSGLYERHAFVPATVNFEDTYQEICDQGGETLRGKIEAAVWQYFRGLQLPDSLTLYDILVLALRAKDTIATFNWDPFLAQAIRRNRDWLWGLGLNPSKYLPEILFLHGNVEIGYCDRHEKLTFGFLADAHPCQICGQPLAPTRLLYPIREKEYNSDPSVQLQWRRLGEVLEQAYLLTVFGYGAPKSDVEAIRLMKTKWDENRSLALNTTEIVNVEPKKTLRSKWDGFFYTPSPHYKISRTLFHSRLALYPRRSCESLWFSTMMLHPFRDRPISRNWRSLNNFRKHILEIFDLGSRYD